VKEFVQPRDGHAVELRPCPAWCTLSEHFTDDQLVDADDGFHHYGPEIAVPTSDRMFPNGPESVVKVILKAWTSRLDAEPGPGRIELQLATTEENTDLYVELTPDEARAVSAALLQLADTAERTDATHASDLAN
jgi:hypothetical protein